MQHYANRRWVRTHGLPLALAGLGGLLWLLGAGVPEAPAVMPGLDTCGIAVDAAGGLFVADGLGCRIWKVDPGRRAQVVAGGRRDGDAGDGGPATRALLVSPYGVAVAPGASIWRFRPGRQPEPLVVAGRLRGFIPRP